jgi:HprK-related kinase A
LKVSDLSLQGVAKCLKHEGLTLPCGPFNVRIRSGLDAIASGLYRLYSDFPLKDGSSFVDFDVTIDPPSFFRRYFRPQVTLSCDGRQPFKPLPISQAFPMLEWGLNWVLSSHAHDYLVIHAAVVERDGYALVLAADPGSGKSTLCAALTNAGWRLLSDELALVDLKSGDISPIARPISLKNKSIAVIRALSPQVVIGDVCRDTAKGDVAHVRPPPASVLSLGTTAIPKLIIFPKYTEGACLESRQVGKAHALAELMRHSFNAPVLGGEAFESLSSLLEKSNVFRATYSSFDQILPEIDRLWELNQFSQAFT